MSPHCQFAAYHSGNREISLWWRQPYKTAANMALSKPSIIINKDCYAVIYSCCSSWLVLSHIALQGSVCKLHHYITGTRATKIAYRKLFVSSKMKWQRLTGYFISTRIIISLTQGRIIVVSCPLLPTRADRISNDLTARGFSTLIRSSSTEVGLWITGVIPKESVSHRYNCL